MKKILLSVAFMLPLSIALISAQNAASTVNNKVEKHAQGKGHAAKEQAEQTEQTAKKAKTPKAKTAVPEAVKTAFKQRFPQVKKVEFDRERNGEYEAEFKENGVKMSANFTADGIWRETETEIKVAELPTAVTQAIAAKYPKAKVVGAAKIETADKGTHYEADLKTGAKKSEILFDEAGNVVK